MVNYSKSVGLLLSASILLNACHSVTTGSKKTTSGQNAYHIGYDDSTLNNKSMPLMMPYNRLINPAGSTVFFGDSKYENHSLDCKLLAGSNILVIEDRYGIALIDTKTKKIAARWSYNDDKKYSGLMSTYSGLQVVQQGDKTAIYWSAANGNNHQSYVMVADFTDGKLSIKHTIALKPEGESPLALPNELKVVDEGGISYLYVVLNGNNQFLKINLSNDQIVWKTPTGVAPYGLAIIGNMAFVTNWAGAVPTDTLHHETAGVPYGQTYTDRRTGATAQGTVSVINTNNGNVVKEIAVGLHPNVIVASPDKRFLYVANGNSDNIYVLDAQKMVTIDSISVKLDIGDKGFIGDSPNAIAISSDGSVLYVGNGLDNAVAVIKLGANVASQGKGKSVIAGFIPTEAYPGGMVADANYLYVTNLEGEGSRVSSKQLGESGKPKNPYMPTSEAYNSHHSQATLSIIPLPGRDELAAYTQQVKQLNLQFRSQLARQLPRQNVAAQPVPERIGEPSVFKHVIYIIKENRTYDQVLGDLPQGNGSKQLCIYGDSITPNQHRLAKDFVLMDNYYASGKSSAEGHQWTDAAMVTDYVEKSVRAWFRSYPHVQTDALVYNKQGFIWNNAMDHGKTVRIYGETATPAFDEKLGWLDIYHLWKSGKPFQFKNYSTIARVRPVMAPDYPGYDTHVINDQIRADAFIKELKEYEAKPGDQWPQLMVMALPADHTGGLKPGLPTPRAMVADNDLALGRIIEAITHSRFYNSTVVFITEDDSQDGWDHVSAYRTTGNVISPYSRLQKEVPTNYNQTCIVRTIEQILGIPPMNTIDATALPMFSCFNQKADLYAYTHIGNKIPLDEMNKVLSSLKGPELYYAKQAMLPMYNHIDGGNDDMLNRMLWFAAKGKKAYPAKLAGHDKDDDD